MRTGIRPGVPVLRKLSFRYNLGPADIALRIWAMIARPMVHCGPRAPPQAMGAPAIDAQTNSAHAHLTICCIMRSPFVSAIKPRLIRYRQRGQLILTPSALMLLWQRMCQAGHMKNNPTNHLVISVFEKAGDTIAKQLP